LLPWLFIVRMDGSASVYRPTVSGHKGPQIESYERGGSDQDTYFSPNSIDPILQDFVASQYPKRVASDPVANNPQEYPQYDWKAGLSADPWGGPAVEPPSAEIPEVPEIPEISFPQAVPQLLWTYPSQQTVNHLKF